MKWHFKVHCSSVPVVNLNKKRHSVVCIDKLIQCNPDIDKYLGYMTSVDDIEWVCKTCHNNLVKNRNPACAVVNGLVFQ